MQATNRYQLLNQLGHGGMGIVYRAHDRLTGETVAYKRVIRNGTPNEVDDIQRLNTVLANEFRVLASLRHPNIVNVLDYGFDGEHNSYFAMTLYNDAKTVVAYAQDKADSEKHELIIQMLQALHYLHQRSILHRDLKPDNVLVLTNGTVKVLDFGLAMAMSDDIEVEGLRGTVAYAAPELFQQQRPSVASDMWAIGMIAYEVFVGEYPFEYEDFASLVRQIFNGTPKIEKLTPHLAQWVGRLLSKDPADRYATVYDALKDFCWLVDYTLPTETLQIRKSFLEASKFVGRDEELNRLYEGLQFLKAGACRVYLIGGESGTGKSRLLDEFRTTALVAGVNVLRGQAVDGGGLPFQVWRSIIRELLLTVDINATEAGILKDVVPDIDNITGYPSEEVISLSEKAQQDRLILTLIDVFRRLDHPTLVILEDLQWTSESLVVVKQLMMRQTQLSSLMVVGTYRDDECPDLPDMLPTADVLSLERFPRSTIEELAEAMLGEVGQNKLLIDLLESETEGNTFFMVEVLQTLAETAGELQQIDTIELPVQVLTGGMKAVLQRRLDKVAESNQGVLQLAAVIGRQIDERLLVHIVPDTNISTWLYNVESASILTVQDTNWQFSHDKIRETILDSLDDEQRRTLHRQVATAIEALYSDNSDYNEVLLEHWYLADDLDKEIYYLGLVARSLILGMVDFDRALDILKRTLDKMQATDPRGISLTNWQAEIYWRRGNYEMAQDIAEQTLQLAESLHEPKNIALTLNTLGNILYSNGHAEIAREQYQRSYNIREQLDDQNGMATSLNNIGITCVMDGQLDAGISFFQRSLELRYAIKSLNGIAESLSNLGYVHTLQGQHEEALKLYGQSLELLEQFHDQGLQANCLTNLGTSYLAIGDERANKIFCQSLAIAWDIQQIPLLLENIISMAKLYFRQDQISLSAELVGFVKYQETVDPDLNASLSELLSELQQHDIEIALERGKSLTLERIVVGLLDECHDLN